MECNLVKWTWFRKNFQGKNVPVLNIIVGDWCDSTIAKLDFEAECQECVERRNMKLHKKNDTSATFLCQNGDFVNVRLVSWC